MRHLKLLKKETLLAVILFAAAAALAAGAVGCGALDDQNTQGAARGKADGEQPTTLRGAEARDAVELMYTYGIAHLKRAATRHVSDDMLDEIAETTDLLDAARNSMVGPLIYRQLEVTQEQTSGDCSLTATLSDAYPGLDPQPLGTIQLRYLPNIDPRRLSVSRTDRHWGGKQHTATHSVTITGGLDDDLWAIINVVFQPLTNRNWQEDLETLKRHVKEVFGDAPMAVAAGLIEVIDDLDALVFHDKTSRTRVERWAAGPLSDGVIGNSEPRTLVEAATRDKGPGGKPVYGTYTERHTRHLVDEDGTVLTTIGDDGTERPRIEHLGNVSYRYYVNRAGQPTLVASIDY